MFTVRSLSPPPTRRLTVLRRRRQLLLIEDRLQALTQEMERIRRESAIPPRSQPDPNQKADAESTAIWGLVASVLATVASAFAALVALGSESVNKVLQQAFDPAPRQAARHPEAPDYVLASLVAVSGAALLLIPVFVAALAWRRKRAGRGRR